MTLYHRMLCPTCKGEPLQFSHEMLTDRVVTHAAFCMTCNGVGTVQALVETPHSQGGGNG